MSTEAVLRSQVIERAWIDPEFKQKLLSDPKAAIMETLGVALPESFKVRTVEEGKDEFFLVLPSTPSNVMKSDVKPLASWS
ncbi:MAG: NHLP leader peptide family natural product precursor [Gorillibacterium sp.]|nr:NHLP leader peptide family natural product precursor [Gorillibacterium sp.]